MCSMNASHALGDELEWLSTKEAARQPGITTRTLYRLVDQGELPAYKMGRVLRLLGHEVDAYTESCRVQPGELSHLVPARAPRS